MAEDQPAGGSHHGPSGTVPAKRGADRGRHRQPRLIRSALFTALALALVFVVASPANAYPTYQGYSSQTHLFQPTVRTGPVGNSGCSYAVSSWYNPDKYPGTGARVWCSGTRLIKLQHALYWMRPGGPSSLYMASPQWSYGVTRDTGEWGYIDVACPKGTWQWLPVVYIWINHQYMGSFPGHWGGFTACEG